MAVGPEREASRRAVGESSRRKEKQAQIWLPKVAPRGPKWILGGALGGPKGASERRRVFLHQFWPVRVIFATPADLKKEYPERPQRLPENPQRIPRNSPEALQADPEPALDDLISQI